MKVTQLIQRHYGSALAVLINKLGDISLAEDALQEASIAALQYWPKEPPQKPQAWLVKVATNKTIDILRKHKSHLTQTISEPETTIRQRDDNYEFDDNVLRIIFICCHPAISPENQLALTLKLAMGFHQKDIARALLLPEKTLEQRITRAKNKIKANHIELELPGSNKLIERLPSVLKTLYLIFNEGYHASSGETLISHQICEQAILMTRILCRHYREQSSCLALLSLMLFTHARSLARSKEQFVPLEKHDRSLYNQQTIKQADILLQKSLRMGQVTSYHIEAAITGLHSQAINYRNTDWQQICLLYDKLLTYHYSPVVQVNKAVAHIMLKQLDIAEQILSMIANELRVYPPYYAALAKLRVEQNNIELALSAYQELIELSNNKVEKEYFKQELARIINQ